jgi:hypothetical protein
MNDDVSIEKVSVDVHTGKAVIDAFGYNFRNEQEFKTAWMNYIRKQNLCEVFEIENEEKEPGFPDLLCIDSATSHAMFFEIKVAEKGGRFKFEPTQPRFYKLHPLLRIQVIVWDAQERKVYCVGAQRAAQAALEFGKATPKGIYLNVREI